MSVGIRKVKCFVRAGGGGGRGEGRGRHDGKLHVFICW